MCLKIQGSEVSMAANVRLLTNARQGNTQAARQRRKIHPFLSVLFAAASMEVEGSRLCGAVEVSQPRGWPEYVEAAQLGNQTGKRHGGVET